MKQETKTNTKRRKPAAAFLVALAASVFFLCSSFCAVAAGTETVDSGPCGEGLTWTLYEPGTLTVGGEGAMWDFYEKAPGWDCYSSRIKCVEIEKETESIGAYAFYHCEQLCDIYYTGSESEWNEMKIAEYNDCLLNATIHFYAAAPETECPHSETTIENAVAATCTKQGYTGDTVCADCGLTLRAGESIAAPGHKSVTDKAVAATCKKAGKTAGKHCSVCGKVTKKQTTIEKKPHTYKTTLKRATVKGSGKKVIKCTVCGTLKSKTVIPFVRTMKISKSLYTYNGKVQKPTVTVKNGEGKTLKNGRDYTAKYANAKSKATGQYTITVTFKGNYAGTKKFTYTIMPKPVTGVKASSTAVKTVKVSFPKVTGANGYEAHYSTKKKSGFRYFGSSSKNAITNKKLPGGKTIYIRVRAYKTVGDVKICGEWSSLKSVKVKSGLSADFIKTMDRYESFMDEYIVFMKKCENDPDDPGLLSDYARFVKKYSKLMDALAALEEEELTDEECAYYLKVEKRIAKKLSNAGLYPAE